MPRNVKTLWGLARDLHRTAFELKDFAADSTAEVMVMFFSSHFITRCGAGHLHRRQPAILHQRSNVAVNGGEADAIHLPFREG